MSGVHGLRRIGFVAASICLPLLAFQSLFPAALHSQDTPLVSSNKGNTYAQEFEGYTKALGSKDPTERQRAAVSLGKSGNPAAVEPLINALKDEDYFVRSFAAIALGSLNDGRAVDPLIKALADPNQRVRRSAAESLGIIKNLKAVDALLMTLNDENVFVRRSAAESLGHIGDPKAIDPLLKALGDQDSYIRTGASIALTSIGGSAVPRLLGALGDWRMGPRIAEILKNLNWHASSEDDRIRFEVAARNREALLQNWESARKILVADLNSGEAGKVEYAAYALIGIGQDDVLDELARILRTRGTPDIANAFLQCGNESLSGLARSWLAENGKEVRAADDGAAVKWGELKS